jgi:superfamily II DNA or RNA helicase
MLKFTLSDNLDYIYLIDSDNSDELKNLNAYFTREIDAARFHPLVKKKLWDGKITFFDKFNRISSGLYGELHKFAKEFNTEISINGLEQIFDLELKKNEFVNFINFKFKDSTLQPRDYQIDAAFNILKYRRSISEIATSAGKTLIFFLVFLYLKEIKKIKKMLIIVPAVSLISQFDEDFEEYSESMKDFEYVSQKIGGGEKKVKKDCNIIIGTFQTLTNLDSIFFDDIDVAAVDEAHHAPTKSVIKVLSQINARYKFGMSGTLKLNGSATSFSLQSSLGPPVNNISAKYLFDNDYASKVKIKVLCLDYLNNEIKESLVKIRRDRTIEGSKKISLEKKLILSNELRFNFILRLIKNLSKNTLVLFTDIQTSYGKKIHEELKINSDKISYYIDGSTAEKLREYYKKDMDKENEEGDTGKVLIASFGTFKQGISIKNIHNIVFVESYKSEIIVKQSIGRGMRLLEGKDGVNIYDISDNFSFHNSDNYMLQHMKARIEIYKRDSYPYELHNIKLN